MKLALIGYPLSHSFSQKYFEEKFADNQITSNYQNIEIKDLTQIRNIIGQKQVEGFNVTIPHKTAIIPFLDGISQDAMEIGAVNVVKVENGKWKGFNTDHLGFRLTIESEFSSSDKALILGTGGASKAISYALRSLGVECTLVSRSQSLETITYKELNKKVIKDHRIIVNTTPVGSFPNIKDSPDIPYQHINTDHLCYDLIYNPEETVFLKNSAEKGAKCINGYKMLVNQAELSWEIWNNSSNQEI